MKKKIPLLVASFVLLSTCLINCGGNKITYTRTKKMVNYIYLDTSIQVDSEVSFFSHRPNVVYIPITDYKYYVPSFSMTVNRNGNDYTFTNLFNDEKAILNADNGILTYNSFSKFKSRGNIPHDEIGINGISQKDETESSYVIGNKYSINLSNYNLAPLKDGNEYYLPIDVLMRIDPMTSKGTAYYDGDNNVTLLYSSFIDTYIEIGGKTPQYQKEFNEYVYDLFTFDIDLLFGLNGYSRPMRSNGNNSFTFNKEGARKTFEKYKNDIISASSSKSLDEAIDKMFDEIDDGGHTVVERCSVATNKEELIKTFGKHKERAYTYALMEKEKVARTNSPYYLDLLSNNVKGYDTDEDGYNDIGYITLTKFDFSDDKSSSMDKILSKANYYFNKNNGEYENAKYIKDVVIDIANNGGGATISEGMLLSFLCNGKAKQVLKDARDNSITTSVYRYDVNSDKKFDEKDYLPSDVNIYVLTDASFSAASALTYDTYMYSLSDEYKKVGKNIKFIGQPNLGGSCSITSTMMLPTGFCYHMSSGSVGINWNDKSITSDEIVPVSDGWNLTLDQIVDRASLNNRIKNARGK